MQKEKHIEEIKRIKKDGLVGTCILQTCHPPNKQCKKECETPGTVINKKVMKILNDKLKELEN